MNGLYDQLPMSKIQSLSTILAEKMECLESMLEGVEGEMVLPVKLLMKWEVAPPD